MVSWGFHAIQKIMLKQICNNFDDFATFFPDIEQLWNYIHDFATFYPDIEHICNFFYQGHNNNYFLHFNAIQQYIALVSWEGYLGAVEYR